MVPDDLDCLLWRNGSWLSKIGRVVDIAYLDFIRLFDPNSMNHVLTNEISRYRFVEGPTEYMKIWAQRVMGSTSTLEFCHCLMCSSTTRMIEKSSCQTWGLTPSWEKGVEGPDKGHRDLKKRSWLVGNLSNSTKIWASGVNSPVLRTGCGWAKQVAALQKIWRVLESSRSNMNQQCHTARWSVSKSISSRLM